MKLMTNKSTACNPSTLMPRYLNEYSPTEFDSLEEALENAKKHTLPKDDYKSIDHKSGNQRTVVLELYDNNIPTHQYIARTVDVPKGNWCVVGEMKQERL